MTDGVLAAELEQAAAYRRALRRFLTRTNDVARTSRLTGPRYELLLNVKASPGEELAVGEIADALCLAPSTATELIQRCEDAGLVQRQPSADDGRVSLIRLTPEGEKRLMEMFLALRADREAFVEAFRAVERQVQAIVP